MSTIATKNGAEVSDDADFGQGMSELSSRSHALFIIPTRSGDRFKASIPDLALRHD